MSGQKDSYCRALSTVGVELVGHPAGQRRGVRLRYGQSGKNAARPDSRTYPAGAIPCANHGSGNGTSAFVSFGNGLADPLPSSWIAFAAAEIVYPKNDVSLTSDILVHLRPPVVGVKRT